MGVNSLWMKSLGNFRKEDRKLISSLSDKRVVIDTSAWMHTQDGIWEVQYARTSHPKYPHPIITNTFAARIRALKALRIHPIFVFDGMSPNMKKNTNRDRQQKSALATEQYTAKIAKNKAGTGVVEEDVRKELLKLRRDISRPILEDYASLSKWMEDNNIDFVQAPFEADAQIKEIIKDGEATAAITEDGDLVVFRVTHILSQTKIDTLAPDKSTCQYFELDELKSGAYGSPIEVGRRAEFLSEISCLSGNDYIDNLPNVGPAVIFGNHKTRKNQTALIDSYIEEVAGKQTRTELEWLEDYSSTHGKKKKSDATVSLPEDWSVDRFVQVRNLIKHYPVFSKCKETGEIDLKPLNPLPNHVSSNEWGAYIGFDKHPSEYFTDHEYKQYYHMSTMASTDQPRANLLGPRYSRNDNPTVDSNKLLPLFAKIDFEKDPINVQPTSVLRAYLLARGVTMPYDTSPDKLREIAHSTHGVKRPVLDPSLVPEPAKWVGFEPLDDAEIGDKYDDWVSLLYLHSLSVNQLAPHSMFKYHLLQNADYVTKLRILKTVDDDYIDHHFGTERAQYQRVTALELLNGGNIGLSTTMIRNVKSELKPGEELIAIKFKCLSEERSIVHSLYMVFENKPRGDYIPSPASFCTCENGAFFCSHMLCFLYIMRGIQVRWRERKKDDIEKMMPEDRRLLHSIPCLIENVLAETRIKRQMAQSNRQAAKRTRSD